VREVRRVMDPVLESMGFAFAGVASIVAGESICGREYSWVGSPAALVASFPVTGAKVEYIDHGPEAVTVKLVTDFVGHRARIHIDGAPIARASWNPLGEGTHALDPVALDALAQEFSVASLAEIATTS